MQLFGLLVLLVPLFAGLQYLIGEGVSRVEIRIVSQDVPVIVPVERIVERIIERVIYVPVPADGTPETAPSGPTPTAPPGSTPTPTGANPGGAGAPSAGAPGAPGSSAAGAEAPGGLSAIGVLPTGSTPDLLAPGVPAPGIAGGLGAPTIGAGSVTTAGSIIGAPPGLTEPVDAKPPETDEGAGLATTTAVRPGRLRVAGPPPVVIASEDRLGAPSGPDAAQQSTASVRAEARRRNGNSDTNDNRSPRQNGGGQSTQSVASSAAPTDSRPSAVAAPIGAKPPSTEQHAQQVPAPQATAVPVRPTPTPPAPSNGSAGIPAPDIAGPIDAAGSLGNVVGSGTNGAAEVPARPGATPTTVRRAKSIASQGTNAGAPRQTTIPAPIGVKPPPED
jgi:hypothetical protein